MDFSENIQMYLVKLALLGESSSDPLVNISSLAESLEVQTVSVNQMVHKLDEQGLVEYQPYKGVSLTEKGFQQAMNILRHRRLWEVFLVEKLNFQWDEVHVIAEQLEHIKSDELIIRLDAYLDHPDFDPHGDPIPDVNGTIKPTEKKLLSELQKAYFTPASLGTHQSF